MVENNTKNIEHHQPSWLDYLALGAVSFAVFLSIFGGLAIFSTQAQVPDAPIWPLPGLVLVDWMLLALIGFITTYFCFRGGSKSWLDITWVITGTLIPLGVLGIFSIGLAVLIALFLCVVSTIYFTIQRRGKLLRSFGLLMLGSIGNLGVLAIIIFLGNINY